MHQSAFEPGPGSLQDPLCTLLVLLAVAEVLLVSCMALMEPYALHGALNDKSLVLSCPLLQLLSPAASMQMKKNNNYKRPWK